MTDLMKFVAACMMIAGTLFVLALILNQKGAKGQFEPPFLLKDNTYQGKSAEWWASKTVHWKKAALLRAKAIRRHKAANHQRLTLGSHGVARAFLCVHEYEGSWQDDGAPYWGGLQMDMSFQRAYGGEFLSALGTANNWPPFVQVAVAMRAYYAGRGFGPWPNTRRMCGI